ncbi:hypothetical protein [Streptomyces ossamyceticus]|uniref:hypothetical protein n=1 Tax=Streptomyces ossamyceticus TaxID=249581 RepID=UPI00342A088E
MVINHVHDDFEVEPVCRELDLSVSGYNARSTRPVNARHLRDERLVEHIRRIHAVSGRPMGPGASTASCDAKACTPPGTPSNG